MTKAEVEQALERHDRLCSNYRYLPFGDAGGPNPCEHGYARGIPCPQCDAAAFATDVPALCRGWLEQEAEIERLKAALEKTAFDFRGLLEFLRAMRILGAITIETVKTWDDCLALAWGHLQAADAALSAASDRQPAAEAPHSYLCAASTEGNPIKIGPCDCRESASDSQPGEKQ